MLDPVPAGDLRHAIVEGIPGLLADLETDTRNVLLTFARIWTTLETGEIRSKDRAADWVLPRLPAEHRPVLEHARAIYRDEAEPDWGPLRARVRPHADYVVAHHRGPGRGRPVGAVAASAPPGARSLTARSTHPEAPMPLQAGDQPLNDRVIADFRANGGAVTFPPYVGARLLLLTSTGARSGEPHVAPLGYTRDGEGYVVVGSNSGRDVNADWVSNVRANPDVGIELRERDLRGARPGHRG